MLNWWGLGSAYQNNPAMGWMLVTFSIFLFATYRFIRRPLADYLQARSDAIRNAIQEGARAREEAESKLKLYENRLLQLDAEIAKMKADFAHQGELEKARLKIEAEQIAGQMLKESEQSMKAEVSRALHDLKKEVADKILASAHQKMPLGSLMDSKLVTRFSGELKEQHA